MALIIDTNIASLSIQGSLMATQNAYETSVQRLSSGLRVNSAKDDAAGLAIADRIDSIVGGQMVATRNANDGISYSQTADSALSSIINILQRMRDLAVQSANFTSSDADRVALNTEFTQLQAEISQITGGTTFNGDKVFDGSAKTFQIGAGTSADNRITIQGVDLTADTSNTGLAAFINNGTSQATVDAATTAFIAAGGTFSTADGSPSGPESAPLNATTNAFANNISSSDQATFSTAKSAFISTGGSFNSVNGNPVMAKSGTATIVVNPGPPPVTQTVPSSTAADINAYNTFTAAQYAYNAAAKGIEILDQPSSLTAIGTIDNAINEVDAEAAKQGAFQNRMNTVISNLQVSVENQSAARSRIMDTDYAVETANLARNQILKQVSTALLAQANQLPVTVLSLLH